MIAYCVKIKNYLFLFNYQDFFKIKLIIGIEKIKQQIIALILLKNMTHINFNYFIFINIKNKPI